MTWKCFYDLGKYRIGYKERKNTFINNMILFKHFFIVLHTLCIIQLSWDEKREAKSLSLKSLGRGFLALLGDGRIKSNFLKKLCSPQLKYVVLSRYILTVGSIFFGMSPTLTIMSRCILSSKDCVWAALNSIRHQSLAKKFLEWNVIKNNYNIAILVICCTNQILG